MDRIPVTSSNLVSVGFDARIQKLEVEFASGAIHVYHNVSNEAHQALLAAESIGSHFAKFIKGVFGSTQIKAAGAVEDAEKSAGTDAKLVAADLGKAAQTVEAAAAAVVDTVKAKTAEAAVELAKAIPAAEAQPLTSSLSAALAAGTVTAATVTGTTDANAAALTVAGNATINVEGLAAGIATAAPVPPAAPVEQPATPAAQ